MVGRLPEGPGTAAIFLTGETEGKLKGNEKGRMKNEEGGMKSKEEGKTKNDSRLAP
jgi:hypothetical protein